MHQYQVLRSSGGRRVVPLSATEQKVADYLKEQNLFMKVIPMGEGREKSGDRDWVFDRWMVQFDRSGANRIESEYKTGLGHRAGPPMPSDVRNSNPRSLHYHSWVSTNVRPYAPCAASVLYSLLSEARLGADNTFDDFCSELGYDTDSRRALETYLACQEINTKLQKLFTHNDIERLTELLEDY